MKAGVILLSGGQSSRMGTNKALLEIAEKPNIVRIKDELAKQFSELVLVSNDLKTYEFLNVRMVSDYYPGQGPLAGIHAGLKNADNDVNLIVACDMPFVTAGLGTILVENIGEHDAVVPVINGRQHPLFAVYHKRIVPEIETCLENNRLRIKHLLGKLNVLYLTEKDFQEISNDNLERIFFNMNHPDEYENAKNWTKS